MNVINKFICASAAGIILLASPQGWAADIPAMQLKDIKGKVAELQPLGKKLTVINFWATWCPPCRKEMPMLSEMAKAANKQGVHFVGIALDQPDAVASYLQKNPVSYRILLSDGDGIAAMKQMGNRSGGLPYTVIVDDKGKLRASLLGEIDKTKLQAELARLGAPLR